MKNNPILIIDDDEDDLEMIKEAAKRLNIERPIHFFKSGNELESFLRLSAEPPFLIISDVNLPGEDGFALKKRIARNKELKYLSVPFIFWSTDASERQIQYAYDLPAQGFFFKANNFDDLCDTFRTILNYWQRSQHPKRLDI